MVQERAQRRLAAILAADIVGYSRMMGSDEAGTIGALRSIWTDIFNPFVEQHRGRIVKMMGDGALVEFGSVVDAVECSVAIQQAMAGRNAEVAGEQAVEFRIGVNLGDIVIEGDDIFGDGVNVAARLESQAPRGGVMTSDVVYHQVTGKVGITFIDAGEIELKNIDRPLRVWRWGGGEAGLSAAQVGGTESAPGTSDKPSIAVLPFANMSNDPEQEYFADGIAEDIITALSRFNQFRVIARNSSFAYKGRNVDIRHVARELGVRYVLEGSVRKGGNRLRITGQLIEAASGSHLWADRFDGEPEDIFALQDRITESVVGAIEPTVVKAEIERARRRPPESLAAYDLFLQALSHIYAMRPEENSKGLDLLHQAIDKDPNYAVALAYCAWGYEQRLTRGWSPHGSADAATAMELARRALATNSDDPHALAAAGFVLVMVARDYDRGLSAIRRAEELNPNVAFVSLLVGAALLFGGDDLDRALAHFEQAIRVSPGDPGAFFFWTLAAFCHFLAGRSEKAVELARRSADTYPDWDSTYWVLAPALAKLGRMDEARSALNKFRELSPHVTASLLRQLLPFRDGNKLEMIVGGLSDAGLPD